MNTRSWILVVLVILILQVLTSMRLVVTTTELAAEMGRAISHIEPPGSVRTVNISIDTSRAYIGNPDAPVHMVIFSDFDCPACAMLAEQIPQLVSRFGDSLCISYRYFPLSSNTRSKTLAELAEVARGQGNFWPYHDSIFALQDELNQDKLAALIEVLGLPEQGVASQTKAVDQDIAFAKKLEVKSTPTVFINGRRIIGAYPLPIIEKIIEEELRSPLQRPAICEE
ncbi:hypothetical protein TRIP_C20339 [Candidatus Zixiibacteriota bacterium]|nr:hypothetical protein TRIP_C20339 [candidate division Zixibacteria bacterium]